MKSTIVALFAIMALVTIAGYGQQTSILRGIYTCGTPNTHLSLLKDELHLNAIQASTGYGGGGWTDEVLTNSAGLRVYNQRNLLATPSGAQRMIYEAEKGTPDIEGSVNYFVEHPMGHLNGNYWACTYNQETEGYMVKNCWPEDEYHNEQTTYYATFRLQISGTYSPGTQVVRCIVHDVATNTDKLLTAINGNFQSTLKAGDFPTDQSFRDFQYSFTVTHTSTGSPARFLKGNTVMNTSSWSNATIDLQVYWYGLATVDLDNIIIDDQPAKDLFAGSLDAQMNTEIENFKPSIYPLLEKYYLRDEPFISCFQAFRHVGDLIGAKLNQQDPPTATASYYAFDRLAAEGNPSVLMFDPYFCWANIPHPSLKDNDAYATSSGIALWTTSEAYNILFQPSVDNYIRTEFQKAADAARLHAKTLVMVPQLHGRIICSQNTYKHPDGNADIRPPSPSELRLSYNLGIAYGAKGFMPYPLPTEDYWYGGEEYYSIGLVGSNGIDHSNNVINRQGSDIWVGYSERWDELKSLNQRIVQMENTLLPLVWIGAKTWSNWTPQWGELPYTAAWAGIVTSVSTGDAQPYVEVGHYQQNGPGGTDYIVVVNRRCANDDIRDITVTLSTAHPAWTVTDVENNSTWLVAGGGSFTDRFNPGDGKVYRLEPRRPLTVFETGAFGGNAQQRLLKLADINLPPDLIYSLAYETLGKCFITSSTDQGATWAAETLLDDGLNAPSGVIFRSPSLCQDPVFTPECDAVWEKVDPSVPGVSHEIRFQRGNDPVVTIANFTAPADRLAMPVLASSNTAINLLLAAWTQDQRVQFAAYDFGAAQWVASPVSGEGVIAANPSVAVFDNYSTQRFVYLAWEITEPEGSGEPSGGILLQRGVMNSSTGISWDQLVAVPGTQNTLEGEAIVRNTKPVVYCSAGGRLFVAWECSDGIHDSVKCLAADYTGSFIDRGAAAFSLGSDGTKNCGISVRETPANSSNAGGIIQLVWSVEGEGLAGAQYSSCIWSAPAIIGAAAKGKAALLLPCSPANYDPSDPGAAILTGDAPPYDVSLCPVSIPCVTANVDNNWNMVSVPVVCNNFTRAGLYPNAIGSAYGFNQFTYSGYFTLSEAPYPATDYFRNGYGYWLKFGAPAAVNYYGPAETGLWVTMKTGWNLLGALAAPVPINTVESDPANIINSNLFGYNNGGYVPVDTLYPGKGYWVHVTEPGDVLLSLTPPQDPPGMYVSRHCHYDSPPPPCSPGTVIPDPPSLCAPPDWVEAVPESVQLFWTQGKCDGVYQVQLASDTAFGPGFTRNFFVHAESLKVGGLICYTEYYWRVRDSIPPLMSGWSAVRHFYVSPPSPPEPVMPANNAIDQFPSLTFAWNETDGAVIYRLQISTVQNFSTHAIDDSTLAVPTRDVENLTLGAVYYWRVAARNDSWWSGWSPAMRFTIGAPPTIPVLSSPANNATNISTNPTLRWRLVSGAAEYRLLLKDAASLVILDTTLTDTAFNVIGLSNGATYRWQVSAGNDFGSSALSGLFAFITVGLAPSAPVLASPANGITGQAIPATLTWNAVPSATSYRLQLSTSSSFTTLFYDYDGLTGTSKQTGALNGYVVYYWRVNVTTPNGTSEWSTVWHFTTQSAGEVSMPVLSSPLNNATGQSLFPTVCWSQCQNATSYWLEVNTSQTFPSISMVCNVHIPNTSYALSLSSSTKYYWRVMGTNNQESSDWSAVWNFTTGANCGGGGGLEMASLNEMDALTITDATGQNQTLYVRNGGKGLSKELQRAVELPPEPVEGMFSVRFRSNKFIETVPIKPQRHNLPPIDIRNANFPLTITWDMKDNNAVQYWIPRPDNPHVEMSLLHRGNIGMNGQGHSSITIQATSSLPCGGGGASKATHRPSEEENGALPKQYTLSQNMPNPFNPSTIINYELPEASHVEMRVYNILGQEIATLVDEAMDAGYHAATFNASSLASGVYFYRIKALPRDGSKYGAFTNVKKMVLVR